MTIIFPEGTYEYYTKYGQHFCAKSETYTGADSLITAQRNGWRIAGFVYREDIFLSGSRHTTLYHFELHKASEMLIMPVVANPFVERLLRKRQLRVLSTRHLPESTVDSVLSVTA